MTVNQQHQIERVRALPTLIPRTYHELPTKFIPYLCSTMPKPQFLRQHMRNCILPIHHPEMSLEGFIRKLGQVLISHPRRPKSIEGGRYIQVFLDLQPEQLSQSTSQTMPTKKDFYIPVFQYQFAHCFQDPFFQTIRMLQKPTMNLALLTCRIIVRSYSLKILQPILLDTPSDHQYDLLQGTTVSGEPLQFILLVREDNQVLNVPQTVSRGTDP